MRCPCARELGEAAKVAILSVTEGDDRPVKYPDKFHAARLMPLNKIDPLPHVDFDMDKCIEYTRRVDRARGRRLMPSRPERKHSAASRIQPCCLAVRSTRSGK